MTEENEESKEISVDITESEKSERSPYSSMSNDELIQVISDQDVKLKNYEDKLKHSLADFANLQKKTENDIQTGVNNQMDKFFLDFLQIYDDFLRAKDAYGSNEVDTTGLDGILKNMDFFLAKYNITPIDALGEIFDPNFHEAISIISDPDLDNDTITKEIRKGYISHNRVIRPALVEITQKKK